MIRYQLPVHSPLTAAAVWSAVRGGEPAGALETLVAERFGAERVALVDSGTTALALALRLAVPDGGPVALPAYACYNLATAADAAPHRVLLYDVDLRTLGPDESSVERVLRAGARAVVVAPLYGMPVAMDGISARCRASGVALIEDAAQHAGARWNGKPVGGFGDLSVISFGRGKGVTAGRGGALLARGARWVTAVAEAEGGVGAARGWLGDVAKLKAQWLFARPSLYVVPASLPFLGLGETVYHRPWPAEGMSRAARGALGETWGGEGAEVAGRRRNAARLLDALRRSTRGFTPVPPVAGGEPGYLRLPVRAAGPVVAGIERARRLGVMPGYPKALVDLPGFGERVANRGEAFPGARALVRELITLPTHSLLGEADLARLEAWMLR